MTVYVGNHKPLEVDKTVGNDFADVKVVAIIYRPARTTMQAGVALTRQWLLEFVPREPEYLDPLMGWTGSGDTRQQLKLQFSSRAAAEAFARHKGLKYVVRVPHDSTIRPKRYGDNFHVDRLVPWSH